MMVFKGFNEVVPSEGYIFEFDIKLGRFCREEGG